MHAARRGLPARRSGEAPSTDNRPFCDAHHAFPALSCMTVSPARRMLHAGADHGAIAMRRTEICFAALAALIAGTALTAAQQGGGLPRPCAALRQVCLQAGFVPQGARAG